VHGAIGKSGKVALVHGRTRSHGRNRGHQVLLGSQQSRRGRSSASELRRLEKERLRSLQAKQRRNNGGADAGVRPDGGARLDAASPTGRLNNRPDYLHSVDNYGQVWQRPTGEYYRPTSWTTNGTSNTATYALTYPASWTVNSSATVTNYAPYLGAGYVNTNAVWYEATDISAGPRVRVSTPEQQAAYERQAAEYRATQEVRETARVSAVSRAKELLLSCLTHEQRTLLEQRGVFRVVSNLGNIFEIVQGRQHNIFKLNALTGVRIEEWCVHVAPYDVPDFDNMLAQKLCIETDEDELRWQANVWSLPNRGLINSSRPLNTRPSLEEHQRVSANARVADRELARMVA